MCLDLTKIRHTSPRSVRINSSLSINFTLCSLHTFKLSSETVYGSDISILKANCVNIGFNPIKFPTYVPSDVDTLTSHLQPHTLFVTSHSCDLGPDIFMPTS